MGVASVPICTAQRRRDGPPDSRGSAPDSPNVAIGTVASGVDGFRRSYREAQAARTVAVAGGQPEPTVIAASDPGLSAAALLGGDIAATRDWVTGVLGDLSADNENDARLRETLRVFLRCGSSYKHAAEELEPALQYREVPRWPGGGPARPPDRRGPPRRRARAAGLPVVRAGRAAAGRGIARPIAVIAGLQ